MNFKSYYDPIYSVTNALAMCAAAGAALAVMTTVAVVEATPKAYNAACEYYQKPQEPDHQKFNYTIDVESDPDFDIIEIESEPGSGPVDSKSGDEPGSDPVDFKSGDEPGSDPVDFKSGDEPGSDPVDFKSGDEPE